MHVQQARARGIRQACASPALPTGCTSCPPGVERLGSARPGPAGGGGAGCEEAGGRSPSRGFITGAEPRLSRWPIKVRRGAADTRTAPAAPLQPAAASSLASSFSSLPGTRGRWTPASCGSAACCFSSVSAARRCGTLL